MTLTRMLVLLNSQTTLLNSQTTLLFHMARCVCLLYSQTTLLVHMAEHYIGHRACMARCVCLLLYLALALSAPWFFVAPLFLVALSLRLANT